MSNTKNHNNYVALEKAMSCNKNKFNIEVSVLIFSKPCLLSSDDECVLSKLCPVSLDWTPKSSLDFLLSPASNLTGFLFLFRLSSLFSVFIVRTDDDNKDPVKPAKTIKSKLMEAKGLILKANKPHT